MIMSKRKCLCGYESRIDNVKSHMKKCKAYPIIQNMQNENEKLSRENEKLRYQIELLEKMKGNSINNINNIDHMEVNNNMNICIYGEEDKPKALKEIQRLIQKSEFEKVVPRYMEMKHFGDGKGNIRIENNVLEVYSKEGWVKKNKESELARLTSDNSKEVVNNYGEKPVANMYKSWCLTEEVDDMTSKTFKKIGKKVEEMIEKNSVRDR